MAWKGKKTYFHDRERKSYFMTIVREKCVRLICCCHGDAMWRDASALHLSTWTAPTPSQVRRPTGGQVRRLEECRMYPKTWREQLDSWTGLWEQVAEHPVRGQRHEAQLMVFTGWCLMASSLLDTSVMGSVVKILNGSAPKPNTSCQLNTVIYIPVYSCYYGDLLLHTETPLAQQGTRFAVFLVTFGRSQRVLLCSSRTLTSLILTDFTGKLSHLNGEL